MNNFLPGLLATLAGAITLATAIYEVVGLWRAKSRGNVEASAETSSSSQSTAQRARLQTTAMGVQYGDFQSLREVGISVEGGEVVALIGPDGSGKSTVLRALMGLVEVTSGDVLLNGASLLNSALADRVRLGLTYVPREPSVFANLNVEENILTALQIKAESQVPRTTKAAVQRELENVLKVFELTALRGKAASALSGSQRQRVELARAWATSPRFLLLDEPFSEARGTGAHAVHSIISYAKERGVGVLITERNAERALIVADRAYVMGQGRVLEEGKTIDLVESPEAREAMHLTVAQQGARAGAS